MSEKPKSDNQTTAPVVKGGTLIEIAKLAGWEFTAIIFVHTKTGEIGASFPERIGADLRRELVERFNLDGEIEKLLLQ